MGLSGHWMLVNIISSEHASEYYVECSSRISEIPPLECWEHSRNLVLQCLHLAPVGKEQIGQHGMFRLSLTPSFVNDDSGTAELIYSTVQAYHEVRAWSQATLCGRKVWVTRGENTATAAVSARREFVRLWCVTSAAVAAAPALESEDVSSAYGCARVLPALPTLGSANSADRGRTHTIGITNRVKSNSAPVYAPFPLKNYMKKAVFKMFSLSCL